jgi:hypothetical protein
MKMKGMLVVFALAVVVGLLMVPIPMLAHHGTSEYDNSKELKLTGIVSSFNWTNPHATLEWNVKTENGGVEHWIAELTSPGTLTRDGWHHDSVKAGDEVTVYLHPTKSPTKTGNFQKVESADGRPHPSGP